MSETTAIQWPPRDPDAIADLVHDDRREILAAHEYVGRDDGRFSRGIHVEPASIASARAAGVGLVRSLDASGGGSSVDRRFAFVSSWTRATPEIAERARETAAAEPERADGRPLDPHWGVRLRYRPPAAAAAAGASGILVHLHGLDGHDWERRAHRPAIQAGWGVLECVYPLANWQRLVVDVDDATSVEDGGRILAHVIDHRFSEIAYAIEACLEDLARAGDEAAARGPLGLLAFSAGGNAASAVAARLRAHHPDRFQGAIIAAAGADLMAISLDSGLADTGLDVRRSGREIDRRTLQPDERDAMVAAYRRHARMDAAIVGPAAGARAGRGDRLLMGRFDRIIPPAAGRELAAALPAAWATWLPFGHYGVYLSAPLVARRAVAAVVGEA